MLKPSQFSVAWRGSRTKYGILNEELKQRTLSKNLRPYAQLSVATNSEEFPITSEAKRKKRTKDDYILMFQDLGDKLGIKEVNIIFVINNAYLYIIKLSDWYYVSRKDIIQQGGAPLLRRYGTMGKALEAMYPDYAWDPVRIAEAGARAPVGYWNDIANHRQFLDRMGERLGIKEVGNSIFCQCCLFLKISYLIL